MTVLSRRHGFVYLKSKKTAGTAVETYFLTRTPLGRDIWHTAANIRKYNLPPHRRAVVLATLGGKVLTTPAPGRLRRFLWRQQIHQHHPASSLAPLLGGFWERAIKVTSVRNPWDIMVSGWQWRREGRGGSPPVTASFTEWASACLSDDAEWQRRIHAYPARGLMDPFVFINGRVVVDVLIHQEAINDGIAELGQRLGISLPPIQERENQTSRDRDYRSYYTDDLAESVGVYFTDIIDLCAYTFDG